MICQWLCACACVFMFWSNYMFLRVMLISWQMNFMFHGTLVHGACCIMATFDHLLQLLLYFISKRLPMHLTQNIFLFSTVNFDLYWFRSCIFPFNSGWIIMLSYTYAEQARYQLIFCRSRIDSMGWMAPYIIINEMWNMKSLHNDTSTLGYGLCSSATDICFALRSIS